MTRTLKKKAGGPLYSGAQGCVFIPSLKCKNSEPENKNLISKLGTRESAEFEMREYEKIMPFIKQIKNYKKYFNTNIKICEPDIISPNNLLHFDDVCMNFKNINSHNVNDNLSHLRLLNMPNLGSDLKVWIQMSMMTPAKVTFFNNKLTELILNAVIPMNSLGVMHNDLKLENIMISDDKKMRIIDWGLAGVTTPHQIIPSRYFMNNPVTFNRPFSTMIISSEINDEILNLPTNFTSDDLEKILSNIYSEYRLLSSNSHGYYVNIFQKVFNLSKENADAFVIKCVLKYNLDILKNFTDSEKNFHLHKYFSDIYRFNTDVWGTLSSFYIMFRLPREHFIMPDATYNKILSKYREIFMMVFSNGHQLIDVNKCVKIIKSINKIVNQKYVQFKPHKITLKKKSIKRKPTPYPIQKPI